MRLVVIESPYAGNVLENLAYAKACVKDCLARGESPYASHLFFTLDGLLDDTKPEERELGIRAGLQWAMSAKATCLYIDRGLSSGMARGVANALQCKRPIEVRSLRLEKRVLERIALRFTEISKQALVSFEGEEDLMLRIRGPMKLYLEGENIP